MAKSPSHKWGQIIGGFLEEAFEKELAKFVKKHKLFLDIKGERTARKGTKVSWVDSFGNAHGYFQATLSKRYCLMKPNSSLSSSLQ